MGITDQDRLVLDVLGIDETRGSECDLCLESEDVRWMMARQAWLCAWCRGEWD